MPQIELCIMCHPLFPGSPESFTLDVLVALLRQENAMDICVINVPEHIKYSEYFVVVSGVSPRHLRAMALYAIKVVTLYFIILLLNGDMHNERLFTDTDSPAVQVSEERK